MKSGVMKDLKPRLVMTVISVFFLFLFIGLAPYNYFKPFFVAAVAGVGAVALWEYFQMVKAKGISPNIKIGIGGAICYTFAIFVKTQVSSLSFLPWLVLVIILTLLFLAHFKDVENALASIATSFFGIIYIVVTFSGIVGVIYFFPQEAHRDGRLWLIYLLAVTKMTDIGGLFIGRFFGKKRLHSKISPNKTVAGAFGGVIFATLTSMVFAWVSGFGEKSPLGLTFLQSIYLGVILSLFAEIGDLAESLLKRDAGVKDSNPKLPGLGGTLDVVDSLLFTIPIVYIFLHMALI